jgi:hypothetical protein
MVGRGSSSLDMDHLPVPFWQSHNCPEQQLALPVFTRCREREGLSKAYPWASGHTAGRQEADPFVVRKNYPAGPVDAVQASPLATLQSRL